ncbi:MAG TPA: rhodanese-like domain-containing protein [Candidatus Paceibacterota bacterium]|nr:rhodanese-like domain-containing protein [Candidatus Paceibacterota bacterium]
MDDATQHFSEVARHARADIAGNAAVIVDVRHDDEWAAGHIPGALHWELARMQNGEFPDIPKDRKVYAYCEAGGRSAQAIELMRQNGWTDLINLGGLKDWEGVGGEVVQ